MAELIATGREDLLDAATAISEMFASAEARLKGALALQVKAGLENNPDAVVRSIRLEQLKALAASTAEKLKSATPELVDSLLERARESGAYAALSEIQQASLGLSPTEGTFAATPDGAGGFSPVISTPQIRQILSSAPAAIALTADLTNRLEDATKRILRWPDDAYKRAIAQSSTDILLGMGTQATAQANAWQALVDQGIPNFKDKSGRTWRLSSYVEMASRTATRRAWDDQHEATMKVSGVELVTIVRGAGSCKECAAVDGKIWRIDAGEVGRIKVLSMASDAMVTVNVAGTLDDARAEGWRHPGCRCRPVAYLPGVSEKPDVTTHDPAREGERARLRDLERRTREAKERAAFAVSPEQKALAEQKVKGLQSQIRSHVKTTGLQRQPRREQINMGNGPLDKSIAAAKKQVKPPAKAPAKVTPSPASKKRAAPGAAYLTQAEGDAIAKATLQKARGEITDKEYRAVINPIKAKVAAAKKAPAPAKAAPKSAPKVKAPEPAKAPQYNERGDVELQRRLDEGITGVKVLSEDSISGKVLKVQLADGGHVVMKRPGALQSVDTRMTADVEARNEMFFSRVARDVGLPAPAVADVTLALGEGMAETRWIVSEFKEGSLISGNLSPSALVRDKESGFAEMGFLDVLFGNSDRHDGNFLVGKDNKVVPIDHGFLDLDSAYPLLRHNTKTMLQYPEEWHERWPEFREKTLASIESNRGFFEETGYGDFLGEDGLLQKRLKMIDDHAKEGAGEAARLAENLARLERLKAEEAGLSWAERLKLQADREAGLR